MLCGFELYCRRVPLSVPPEKTLDKTPPPSRKLPPFAPPPLGISVALPRGRGYGHFLELHNSLFSFPR